MCVHVAFHTKNSHQFLFSFDWCPVLVGQTTLQFSSSFCRLKEQLRGKGEEQFTEWFGSMMGAAESDRDPPEQQQKPPVTAPSPQICAGRAGGKAHSGFLP